jgi:hypothetical protein
MAEHQLPKLIVRVRFPSSAPTPKALVTSTLVPGPHSKIDAIQRPCPQRARNCSGPRALSLSKGWTSRLRLKHDDGPITSEGERLDRINRLLADDLPATPRLIGLLGLVFGQPLSRIVRLPRDSVTLTDGQASLRLGRHPFDLPPEVATVVHDHLAQLNEHRNEAAHSRPLWLFPRPATRPTTPRVQRREHAERDRHPLPCGPKQCLASNGPTSTRGDPRRRTRRRARHRRSPRQDRRRRLRQLPQQRRSAAPRHAFRVTTGPTGSEQESPQRRVASP